jgi:hypothetical protein
MATYNFGTFDPSGWQDVTNAGRRNTRSYSKDGLTVDFGGVGYFRGADGEKQWYEPGTLPSDMDQSQFSTGYSINGSPVQSLDYLKSQYGATGPMLDALAPYIKNHPLLGSYVDQNIYEQIAPQYSNTGGSDFWESYAVPAMMSAFAGGALGGVLPTSGFEGLGTFGSSAAAAGGNVFTGAANTANAASAAPVSAAPSTAGVSMTEAQALQNSLFPATTSAAPAINTAAPAFGSTLGSVGAPNLGFALPGMGVNLANSGELLAGAGSAAAGAGALSGAAKVGSTLTQPTGNTTFGIPNNILAGGLQGLLGYFGANQQSDAFQDVYNQQSAIGAPYRNLLQASYQPGFTMANEPGYKDALDLSTDSFLRAASAGRAPGVGGGNPMDNPGAWAETMKYVNSSLALPQLNTYRGQLGQFGGMGLNTAGQSSLMGAQTSGGGLNAIGYGLNTAFQQPSAADEYYRAMTRRLNTGMPTNGVYNPV